jgi:hypothetical protein
MPPLSAPSSLKRRRPSKPKPLRKHRLHPFLNTAQFHWAVFFCVMKVVSPVPKNFLKKSLAA